jgi:hypothetical protein
MNVSKINDIEIKKVKLPKTNTEVFGSDILPNPYGLTAMVAKTNSGKTNTLYNILQHTVDPKRKSNVVIFCSTLDLDDTYKKIIKLLEKKKCNVYTHHHFIENGENLIQHYLDIIEQPPPVEDEKDKPVERILMGRGFVMERPPPVETKNKKKKNKEPEKLSPKWIFIFDDIPGKDLRHNALNYVMRARHFKIRTFILTQHLSNISPLVRKQISTCLLFRSFSKDKLQMIYEDLDIEIPFKIFEELYKFATKDPYSFLTYDVYKQIFRKNFNILLKPDLEEE